MAAGRAPARVRHGPGLRAAYSRCTAAAGGSASHASVLSSAFTSSRAFPSLSLPQNDSWTRLCPTSPTAAPAWRPPRSGTSTFTPTCEPRSASCFAYFVKPDFPAAEGGVPSSYSSAPVSGRANAGEGLRPPERACRQLLQSGGSRGSCARCAAHLNARPSSPPRPACAATCTPATKGTRR